MEYALIDDFGGGVGEGLAAEGGYQSGILGVRNSMSILSREIEMIG